ncbi:rhomboid family intramembrane serine protease [Rhodococcus sp. HNM0569]|uniref:rhomboid family intramembrane serine protease n=1 Tax=Rhodococcus sp. HNM0569 TaxID=2716340 RepID=UPI00146F7710|nr:rhomboid family intramembrane serine protease [Rhodococcus sp. HNM0569]NLU83857.1 rhomboid family intramembrane serine protease [Rhodococcus sp. HNM0569]
MSTGPMASVLLAVALVSCLYVGGARTLADLRFDDVSRAGKGLCAVVVAVSIAQWIFPVLGTWFARDPVLVRDGQWWRVVTSAFVQSGGVVATVLGLAALVVVVPVAERAWGAPRAALLLVAGQVVFGLASTFVFTGASGAGTGVAGAVGALAGSLVGVAALSGPPRRTAVAAIVAFAIGLGLVVADDVRGFALLAGILLGAALATVSPPRHERLPQAWRTAQRVPPQV